MPDGDRLAAILARLDAADAAWLAHLVEQPGQARKRRGVETAAAALEATAIVAPGLLPTPAAHALQHALDRYLAGQWRNECGLAELPDDGGPLSGRRAALHRLARATNGRGLRWRRFADILLKARTS